MVHRVFFSSLPDERKCALVLFLCIISPFLSLETRPKTFLCIMCSRALTILQWLQCCEGTPGRKLCIPALQQHVLYECISIQKHLPPVHTHSNPSTWASTFLSLPWVNKASEWCRRAPAFACVCRTLRSSRGRWVNIPQIGWQWSP